MTARSEVSASAVLARGFGRRMKKTLGSSAAADARELTTRQRGGPFSDRQTHDAEASWTRGRLVGADEPAVDDEQQKEHDVGMDEDRPTGESSRVVADTRNEQLSEPNAGAKVSNDVLETGSELRRPETPEGDERSSAREVPTEALDSASEDEQPGPEDRIELLEADDTEPLAEQDGDEPPRSKEHCEPPSKQAVPASGALVAGRVKSRSPSPGTPFTVPRRSVPLHDRIGREAIGIAVLVVLALICAGLIVAVVIRTRQHDAVAASQAAAYAPPSPLPTLKPTKTVSVVAVIDDGSTTSAASGVTGKQRWTFVLASSLGATVSTDASTGMGYATKGASGDTFVQAGGAVPRNAEVVVFFGGAADSNVTPSSLATAATNAFAAAKQQAPKATILVVGPAISSGVSSAALRTIRTTLHNAAAAANVTWVDPIKAAWLPVRTQNAFPSALSVSDETILASKMQDEVIAARG